MDIQLRNENTLNLLEEVSMPAPFVLMTGYDRFMMNAFEKNSIDFMLKPISQERVSIALKKYRDLQNHFSPKIEDLLWVLQQPARNYRQRLLLKKGREFFFINVEDIAYIYTDRGIVIIADFNNQKFISEYKILNTLEEELDPRIFFRANRKYIINIRVIKKFSPFDRVKLSVDFIFRMNEEIVISQENATAFKNWVGSKTTIA